MQQPRKIDEDTKVGLTQIISFPFLITLQTFHLAVNWTTTTQSRILEDAAVQLQLLLLLFICCRQNL